MLEIERARLRPEGAGAQQYALATRHQDGWVCAAYSRMTRRQSGDEAEAMARGHWGHLREVLGHLAWSAADQIEWLGSVMLPDELALDFDNVYGARWLSREAGWITDELSGYLDEIDRLTVDLTDEGPDPGTPRGCRVTPPGSA